MTPSNEWSPAECEILSRLTAPPEIQGYLDSLPYSSDPVYRSPRSVMRDRKAHCFDGAVFAAAALERIGFPPLIMELKADRDDDHLLALFRVDDFWGAVAKSNFAGLRFREPIYRNLREMALSYFASYFNLEREKTLRAYSVYIHLDRFRVFRWHTDDRAMERMEEALNRSRHFPLISERQISGLAEVDERTFKAETLGLDMKGVYRPEAHPPSRSRK